MISIMIDMFLLSLLVFIAVMILRTGKLFAVIVMSGGYSLTSAAIFVNLDAVDVALPRRLSVPVFQPCFFWQRCHFCQLKKKLTAKVSHDLTRR